MNRLEVWLEDSLKDATCYGISDEAVGDRAFLKLVLNLYAPLLNVSLINRLIHDWDVELEVLRKLAALIC